MPDARDLVVEALASSEHDLAETCAGLRVVLSAALCLLHEREVELTRQRESHRRLVDEYRAYRAATMHQPRAA